VNDVFDEDFDANNQILFEFRLLALKVVSHCDSLLHELTPVLVDNLGGVFITLFVDVIIFKVAFEKTIHFNDWSEFNLDN